MLLFFSSLFFACDREDFYADSSLYENIRDVYEDCNPSKIDILKKKNNIQTLFTECGSNNINEFAWSPDGSLVYFQLFTGGYILNPSNKGVDHLPIGNPVAKAAWIHQGQLAIPTANDSDPTANPNLSLYITGGIFENYPMPGTAPKDTQMFDDHRILLSLIDDSNTRTAYFFDTKTKEFSKAFPFIRTEIKNIDAAVDADILSYTDDSGVHVVTLEGKEIASYPKAKRGIPHPTGKYLALEVDGKAISPLHNQTVTYKTPEAKAREEARMKKKLEELPDWLPKEIIPAEIHVVNMESMTRYRMRNFYGEKFAWYPDAPYYCSFYLRGIEGQLLNNNISLTNIGVPLLMADNGDTPSSIEVVQ